MIIETGTIVFLSLIIMVWRMPRRAQLWIFGHPLWLELPLAVLAYALHYGTFSGMMAAATACCICFVFITVMKKIVGYIGAKGKYYPGLIDWKRTL